jgi:thiol-disulfide isomerase/thioredoxin
MMRLKYLLPVLCLSLLAGCSPREKTAAAPAPVGPVHTKGAEPIRIAYGEEVKLTDYLVPGKTTVFDFTSPYCPPCRAYEEPLHALHQQRADVAIVKVDINRPGLHQIDWQSPVAQQYGMDSIPHFKIFGPDGKLVAEDTVSPGPARQLVNQWLGEMH